jgi:GT2 family glycosyltransferase
MHNISIYLSSRNNYTLLEEFIQRNPKLSKYYFVNIDDHSDPEQQNLGKHICEKYGIPFVTNQARGLQNAAKTMIEHLKETDNESKFIVWMTHDSNIITPDFFEQLETLIANDKLSDFGIIGFNILGPQCNVNNEQQIHETQCGMLGRATLTDLPGRGGWYRTPDMQLLWAEWGGKRAIAVESPVDMGLAINVDLFERYIQVSDNYHLFCAFDDICMQFMEHGIYNVTLPFLQIWHDQHIKEGKVPVKSARAAQQGDSKHFGDYGPHFIYWKQRWGWERDDFRKTFPKDQYLGTLFYDFYVHDWKSGPIMTFEL